MSRVRLDPDSIPRGEIFVSSVERPDPPLPGYNKGAIIPVLDSLRPIDEIPGLYDKLVAEPDTPSSVLIERVCLSDRMLKAVMFLSVQTELTGKLEAMRQVFEAGMPGTSIKYANTRSAEPGFLVGTIDPAPGERLWKFVGLHLDNRDSLACANRANSHRRIVVNVGPGGRWGLFCMTDAIEVAERLGHGPEHVPRGSLFGEFVDTYPGEVQCIWIPVPAGSGYVANTDLLLHDGSTFDATESSAAVALLGHWERGSLAKSQLASTQGD